VFLHDPSSDSLVFRYVVGPAADTLTGQSIPASSGIAGRVFQAGVPELTTQVGEHAQFNKAVDAASGFHTESLLTVPVKRPGGQAIGVMQMLNARGPSFDARDLEVLQVLCAQAAAAIEYARLQQEARRAEIVNLIGDISHDIKNMLTPIQSGVWTLMPMLDHLFAELDALRARCPDTEKWGDEVARAAATVRDDYQWMLRNALDAADQVQARTKEIADAVKGELSPPVFVLADLNDTARDVAQALRLVAEQRGVRLLLDLDAGLPRAEIDARQVYNALYNLVNNALPETPEGGSVTVRTRGPADAGEDRVCVEVEDTGRGIPEDVKARLFTDAAVSTKPGGTGLGTRIVAGVVRRHRGTITVDSEPGRGSRFTIVLPLRHDDHGSNSNGGVGA
jgi:signal transduction histidine kinase